MTDTDISAAAVPLGDRKLAILAAALAVFSDKGIEAATIDDIRRRSQASVGSIYHHFGTKESIAATLFTQGLDAYWTELIAAVRAAPNAERAIHGLVEAHVGWIVAKPDLARFMFARRQAVSAEHEQTVRQCTAGHFKTMLDILKPWFKQGILRRLPYELYGPLLMGPAQELARHWLGGRATLDPRSAVDELSRAAWFSLAADPSRPGSPLAQ
jgi:AcrR family transcriptional regulator